MSRRSNIRKRIHQKKRHRSSRKLAAPISATTGLECQAYQLPSSNRLSRFSTAGLIAEISERLTRPQRAAFREALAEVIAESR